jgi:flavodoxin
VKILIAYFSQTGNTEKIAQAIHEEVLSSGHEAHLKRINEITSDSLSVYDLVLLGSACHDTDLARPAKRILAGIAHSPTFKLAGFVTHATYMPEGGQRARKVHEEWASRCVVSFNKASEKKRIGFLGYFSCQGVPSPPIEEFIHGTIVTDEDEWKEYIEEVVLHPNEEDLQNARGFARMVLSRFNGGRQENGQ